MTMTAITHEEYRETALTPFAGHLKNTYYSSVAELCEKVTRQIDKIKQLEPAESPLQYVLLCEQVLAEARTYISNRQLVYLPYVEKLSEKEATQHNCAQCSGNCKLEHDAHVMELNATNDLIRKTLDRLKMTTLPLYSETIYPDEFRILRTQMTLLDNHLSELVFLESNYLIPKIRVAQKNINALSK